jgi:tRNA-dihydrouridine synthase B
MNQTISKISGNTLWLAPLAGLTDRAFRILCRRAGADVVVSEMVSADGLLHDSRRTFEYLYFTGEERPFGIQLFGSDPAIMARAAEIVASVKPDFIDINFGCPVKKVVKRNAGSALMRDPALAAAIVSAMKRALEPTGIPLTAKIRSGWDAQSINAVDFARALEDAGVDLIAVHPRTRSQMYAGRSDWAVTAAVKRAVSIPVVGNGDVRSASDAIALKDQTGCDAIMIGRGALGSPWRFAEIRRFCLTGAPPTITYVEKFDWIRQHVELVRRFKNETRAAIEMRIHLAGYTKGLSGGAAVRERIQHSTVLEEILGELQRLYHG